MGVEIDKYHLNMYCICLECQKRNRSSKGPAHSCEAYPKKNGIPSKIWNSENAECPHFVKENTKG